MDFVSLEGNFAANIINLCGEIERLDWKHTDNAEYADQVLQRVDECITNARLELEYLARIQAVYAPQVFEVREFWERKHAEARDKPFKIPRMVKTAVDWDAMAEARREIQKPFGEL